MRSALIIALSCLIFVTKCGIILLGGFIEMTSDEITKFDPNSSFALADNKVRDSFINSYGYPL
jgi:hypothetical protein